MALTSDKSGTNLSVVFDSLIADYNVLHKSLNDIYNESQNIRILSFNSSIEAARAGEAGKGFRVIANEIKRISEKNDSENRLCQEVVNKIENEMFNLIGIRTAEMAFDIIDKIDRNLFERYCDVQAWATFGKIIECLYSPCDKTQKEAQDIIENLVRIYEVYHDVLLVNLEGIVVCAGVHKNLLGTSVAGKSWFSDVLSEKQATYSDMYFSPSMGDWTISYSSPVVSASGEILGVISTRFNWNFILEIMKSAQLSDTGRIYVVNSKGLVIASRVKEEIGKVDLKSTEAFKAVSGNRKIGYYNEKTGSENRVWGYALTPGYNSYKGKSWSVVVTEIY